MLAPLRTLQPADNDPALLPLDVLPTQIARLADAQSMIEGEPDGSSIA
jgi:hypothetical protein